MKSFSQLGERYNLGLRTFSRGLYFEVASRGVFREVWPLLTAIIARPLDPVVIQELAELVLTMKRRLQTVLRVRDQLLLALSVPQDNDTADDTVIHFDHICLLLKGIIDALAAITHVVLRVSGDMRYASWTNPGWTKKVEQVIDINGEIVGDEAPGIAAVKILSTLRNTIHEVGVGSAIFFPATGLGRPKTPFVRFSIPSGKMTYMESILKQKGNRYWGIDVEHWGPSHVSPVVLPGQYVERMLREIIFFVESIIHSVADQDMNHRKERDDNAGENDPHSPSSPAMQDRILWQLGLNDLIAIGRLPR